MAYIKLSAPLLLDTKLGKIGDNSNYSTTNLMVDIVGHRLSARVSQNSVKIVDLSHFHFTVICCRVFVLFVGCICWW
jgi:hypothetical protein